MIEQHNNNGDSVMLSGEEQRHLEEDIIRIDAQLLGCKDKDIALALTHLRRHLAAEMAAGRRLPILPDPTPRYDYEILPRPASVGGGWQLRLLRSGVEMGGGIFPVTPDTIKGTVWWDRLLQHQRQFWMGQADSIDPADAYYAYLLDEAWNHAVKVTAVWLDRFGKD